MKALGFGMGLVASTALLATAAQAQEPGSAEKGRAYAMENCAECHGVRATDKTSPIASAPRFVEVANTSGMTETAVTVWLQTSHPTMPNLVVESSDRRNIAAYIVSLKQ